MGIATTIESIPTKFALLGGAILAGLVAVGWFIDHERTIGERKCKNAQVTATAESQTTIDNISAKENPQFEQPFNMLDDALKGYKNAYQQPDSPHACPRVPVQYHDGVYK